MHWQRSEECHLALVNLCLQIVNGSNWPDCETGSVVLTALISFEEPVLISDRKLQVTKWNQNGRLSRKAFQINETVWMVETLLIEPCANRLKGEAVGSLIPRVVYIGFDP